MDKENKRRHIPDEEKRDSTADKKRIKKALKIILIVFLALGALLGILEIVTEWLSPEQEEVSYEDFRFFPVDYERDILQDELYLAHDRRIYFTRLGEGTVLRDENAADAAPAAKLFYAYINCIIKGDYEKYPSFFSDECKSSANFELPEKFTMQGLYDININFFRSDVIEYDGENIACEIYEVSYRIFENNGTFRSDILPDETRTLVFEIYIINGEAIINAIGNRANG